MISKITFKNNDIFLVVKYMFVVCGYNSDVIFLSCNKFLTIVYRRIFYLNSTFNCLRVYIKFYGACVLGNFYVTHTSFVF